METSASTNFKAPSGNSACSPNMTIGTFGRTCLISAAMNEPFRTPRWCSITIASTVRDEKSRKPSWPLVAVTSSYPFSSSKLS